MTRGGPVSVRKGGARVRDRSPRDNNNNNNSNSAASAPPDYHFHIRRALRACVEDPDFQKALSPEGTRVEVEEVLEDACAACDAVAQALPTADPVNFDALAASIKSIITNLPKCSGNTAAANRFAAVFIQRTRQFLTKVEPPPPSKQLRGNKGESGPASPKGDEGAPEKVHRAERTATNRGRGGFREPVAAENAQNTNIPPPPAVGGILGDAPPLGAPVGGALFSAPPSAGRYQNNNFGRGQGILDPYANGGYQPQQPYQQQPGSSSSNPLAVFKPAPDIGTRYVTLRGIPEHMASKEILKGALETIVNTGQKTLIHIFFLNYEVFQLPPTVEGGAPAYYAVVSFNSVPAASEIADRVNKMSKTDGSPVTAEGSNAEEIAQFWGEARDRLEELEMQLLRQFNAIDAAKKKAIDIEQRIEAIGAEVAAADEAIRANQAPELKEALKTALKTRIALNKEKEELFAQRRANNESAGLADVNSTELAVPDKFSSSSAQPFNTRHLLYITDIAEPLPDHKVLLLLNRLEIDPKHIWRDEGSNMLCVELNVFGAVIGALRRLDFLDFSFANMKFTNEKPRK